MVLGPMEAKSSCCFQSLWKWCLHGQMKLKQIVVVVVVIGNLWFDVKMHCAKSYRPFELFVN